MERLPFITLDYLREGTRRQRWAYHNLTDLGIVEILKDYTPLLAGTVPLDIDIATSDLDIICHWQDAQEFTNTLEKHWGERPDFRVYQTALAGHPTVLVRFRQDDFELEIVGQNRPSHEQEAYRHMVREYEIMQKMGPAFKEQIRGLKRNGLKTEPAFAKLLGLNGDPYRAVLDYVV